MTSQDEELLAEWLLCWEEAQEQGRATSAADWVGTRLDLLADLERRIRILEATAWLDDPLDTAGPGWSTADEGGASSALRPPRAGDDVAPRRAIASGTLRSRARGTIALAGLAGVVVTGIALARLANHAPDPNAARTAPQLLEDARHEFFHARYAEAEAGFTRALELQPDDPDALLARGISRLKLGRLDAAVADLTATLARAPTDREALRQRAQAHAYLKRYDDAIRDLERLIDAGGDPGGIRRQIEALRHAQAGATARDAPDQPRLP